MKSQFPYSDPLICPDHQETRYSADFICERLGPLITAERRERIDKTIQNRTYTVSSVMEDIYDRGNASAVFRSSEAMGFQRVDIVQTSERFKNANRVSQGAEKWLDIHKWNSTQACLLNLKKQGYRICVTSLSSESVPLDEMTFAEPTTILLGNEKDGASSKALEMADIPICIPMLGFVQSFNISVAAALIFYHIRQWRMAHLGRNGDLSESEQKLLRAEFYCRSVTDAWQILRHG